MICKYIKVMKIVYYQIDLMLLIRHWKCPFNVRFMKKKSSLGGARTHESLGSTVSWLGSIKFAHKIWIFKEIRLNLPSVFKISRLYLRAISHKITNFLKVFGFKNSLSIHVSCLHLNITDEIPLYNICMSFHCYE